MSDRIHIRPGFVALVCGGAYFGSIELLSVFVLAALLHEIGHIAAAKYLGLHIHTLTLSAQGAELTIREEHTSFLQDLLLSLSGPVINLLAAAICAFAQRWPLFLGANVLLGLFNLLPLRPLDGGNALFALLSCFCSMQYAQRIMLGLSIALSVAVTVLGVVLFFAPGGKPYLLLLGLWLIGCSITGKVN